MLPYSQILHSLPGSKFTGSNILEASHLLFTRCHYRSGGFEIEFSGLELEGEGLMPETA